MMFLYSPISANCKVSNITRIRLLSRSLIDTKQSYPRDNYLSSYFSDNNGSIYCKLITFPMRNFSTLNNNSNAPVATLKCLNTFLTNTNVTSYSNKSNLTNSSNSLNKTNITRLNLSPFVLAREPNQSYILNGANASSFSERSTDRYTSSTLIFSHKVRYFSTGTSSYMSGTNYSVKSDNNISKKVAKPPKKTIMQKIMDECSHYYYGTKLFFLDVKVASRYIKKVMTGNELTVRERNQLKRTLVDMCRIVPFLALVLIPFAEFALPFIVKIFPGFLPSSFQGHHRTKTDITVQKLKMDLEYRSVMYQEIEKYHFKPGDNKSQRFATLIDEVRAGRRQLKFRDLIIFSQYLTEDDLAEILTSEQLQQLLQQNLLEFNSENSIDYFDEKAQQKIQDIQDRDFTLLEQVSSGFSQLTHDQLVEECSSRGIIHNDLPSEILRQKLHRWIHFSVNKNVPILFLLLTRIHESEDSNYISNIFKSLPERFLNELEINIAEEEGEELSHETMYDIIKNEEEVLKMEKPTNPELKN